VLAVLPFFHVTGMQGSMNGPLFVGATVVLLPRWDRTVAARLIERYRVTSWTAKPPMVVAFLAQPGLTRAELASIDRMSGGRAAAGAVRHRIRRRLGPDRDDGAVAHQPAAASEAAVPRYSDLRHRFACRRRRHDERVAARRGRRDRHARSAGVPGLLEQR